MTDFRSFEQKLADHRQALADLRAIATAKAKARMKAMTAAEIRAFALGVMIKEELVRTKREGA